VKNGSKARKQQHHAAEQVGYRSLQPQASTDAKCTGKQGKCRQVHADAGQREEDGQAYQRRLQQLAKQGPRTRCYIRDPGYSPFEQR
jgi:hypothetical protein